MNKMTCTNCGKKFSYRLIGAAYPGCKTSEDINCPYCNNICGNIMTSQFVETIKEDTEQQSTRNPEELLIEQETEMMEDMTEGQLAEYLAENYNDFGEDDFED